MSDIRPAVDAGALADLEQRSYESGLGDVFAPHPYPFGDVLTRWALILEDPDVSVLGAWDGDDLVGYAAFDQRSLRHLGVRPDRFGTGLADALLDRAMTRWRAAGVAAVELWVLEANTRARRFYARRGWSPDGRRRACAWPPYPDEIGYRLLLA